MTQWASTEWLFASIQRRGGILAGSGNAGHQDHPLLGMLEADRAGTPRNPKPLYGLIVC